MVESVADGNCLLWTLRALLEKDPQIENESDEAMQQQHEIRQASWLF